MVYARWRRVENPDHKTLWLGFVNAKPQYLIAILVAVCANIVISILYHLNKQQD